MLCCSSHPSDCILPIYTCLHYQAKYVKESYPESHINFTKCRGTISPKLLSPVGSAQILNLSTAPKYFSRSLPIQQVTNEHANRQFPIPFSYPSSILFSIDILLTVAILNLWFRHHNWQNVFLCGYDTEVRKKANCTCPDRCQRLRNI